MFESETKVTATDNDEILESGREHRADDLIDLFDGLFVSRENTQLVRGDGEPIYLPATDNNGRHQVVFAHGFFSSALHEIAHWCIAGNRRRQQVDYGYWYAPDGRSAKQQQAFEQVEVKPQALEWIFSQACNKPFRISVDNLSGENTDPAPFSAAVRKQVDVYCQQGMSLRPRLFRDALCRFYNTEPDLRRAEFEISDFLRDDK